MVTLCWAAKGGSGTTVVASALALNSARPSLLVDLDGEIPTVLGLPEPDLPGIADWITSDAPPEHLQDLLIEFEAATWLLPWRGGSAGASSDRTDPFDGPDIEQRWQEFARWLTAWALARYGDVTIDSGTGEPNAALINAADRTLLVTRPCYLALRRRSQLQPATVRSRTR
jgi:hypothetical protein